MMKKIGLFLLLIQVLPVSAVYVNHQGTGEVLLVPYYTANNNLNTLVSVTNSTEDKKAIKINIREGLNGHAVLSYNVYLDAYDSWTFVMVADASTIDGYVGQNSATLYSTDTSCAPTLQKAGEELRPYELIDGPQDMSRVREGFIEIIEMGELLGQFAQAVDQGSVGVPANCAAIDTAWRSGGLWDSESGGDPAQDIGPVGGGLMVEADLIDVTEGINYSIPVTALADFFAAGSMAHVNPADTSLSLNAAAPEATVFSSDKAYQLAFDSGIDAVSAVLMSHQLISSYALDSVVAGKSETIFIQPTRRFHVDFDSQQFQPPYKPSLPNNPRFPACKEGYYGGHGINQMIADRDSSVQTVDTFCGPQNEICGSVYVHQFLLPGNQFVIPQITGSDNFKNVSSSYFSGATENGFSLIEFNASAPISAIDMNTDKSMEVWGLPVIGVSLTKYTNAGAVAGLLAQYGASATVKSNSLVVEAGEDISSYSSFSQTNVAACE